MKNWNGLVSHDTEADGQRSTYIHCPYCYRPEENGYRDDIDIEPANTVDIGGESCLFCHESFHASELHLSRHITCGRLMHDHCHSNWVAEHRHKSRDTLCPQCNEVINYFGPFAEKGVTFGSFENATLQRLSHLLSSKKPVTFIPGDLIRELGRKFLWMPSMRLAFNFNRHYRVPQHDETPGSEFFYGAPLTLTGAMLVQHCDHIEEFIPFTATQTYKFLSALYLEGYCPATYRKVTRVQAERGTSLPDLISTACELAAEQGSDMVDIPYVQLTHLFPDFVDFQRGLKLMIKVVRTLDDNSQESYTILTTAMMPNPELTDAGEPFYHELVDEATTAEIIERLGGLGSGPRNTSSKIEFRADTRAPEIRFREGQFQINSYRDINMMIK